MSKPIKKHLACIFFEHDRTDLKFGETAARRLVTGLRHGPNGCWEWVGGAVDGYGRIGVGSRTDGSKRTERTHRLAWMLINGPIPAGKIVCHTCDNRRCCNPAHLWLGTIAENLRDMDEKGRRVNTPHPGERNGRAVLTAEQVAHIRDSDEMGTSLARKFGVHKSTIYSIRKRRNWKEAVQCHSTASTVE